MGCILCKNNCYSDCHSYGDSLINNIVSKNTSVDVYFVPVIWGTKCKLAKVYNKYADTPLNIPILCTCIDESMIAIKDINITIYEKGETFIVYEITVSAWCIQCDKELSSRKRVIIPYNEFVDKEIRR